MCFYIRHRFLCGHNAGHTEVMQLCPTAEATQGLHCVTEGAPVEDLVVRVLVHSHCHSCRGDGDTEQASAGAEMDEEYAKTAGLLWESVEQPLSDGVHGSSTSSNRTTAAPTHRHTHMQQVDSQPTRPSPSRNSVTAENQQSEPTTTMHPSNGSTQPSGTVDPYVRALSTLEMDAVDGLLNLRRGPTSHPRNP